MGSGLAVAWMNEGRGDDGLGGGWLVGWWAGGLEMR